MINADDFIFHTRLFPFSIPQTLTFTVNSTGSVTASQTKTIYSDWQTVHGTKIGWQTIFTVAGSSQLDWWEYPLKLSGSTVQVVGRPNVEFLNGQMRAYVTVTNNTTSAQTFTARDFNYEVFVYQLNNT